VLGVAVGLAPGVELILGVMEILTVIEGVIEILGVGHIVLYNTTGFPLYSGKASYHPETGG
jgi:hypothetical protein